MNLKRIILPWACINPAGIAPGGSPAVAPGEIPAGVGGKPAGVPAELGLGGGGDCKSWLPATVPPGPLINC